MKLFITIIAWVAWIATQAQETNYWVGGAVGNPCSWNEDRNWSTREVPTEDTKVVIEGKNSGHGAQPVIWAKAVALSVEIRTQGLLEVTAFGSLNISGEEYYSEGIQVYGGQILNRGHIQVQNLSKDIPNSLVSALTVEGELIVAEPSITNNN